MKIDRLEIYHVKLPLVSPWRTAYGEDAEAHSLVVRMSSGEASGWAESTPLYAPTYSPEGAPSAFVVIREFLAPRIIGQEIESARALNERLSCFKGNYFAKAALEMAWWMLEAELQQKPLHQLLGGTRTEVEAGADFGVQDSVDLLLEKVQGAVEAGFPRVKLKMKPGWDLDVMRAVRSTFPDLTFHVDCNSGYTLEDLPLFRQIDRLGLAMIEQPLAHDDLVEHAELQRQIGTPICLDESVKSVRHARLAIQLGSCRVVNIKPGRVGGLQNALDIHNLCAEQGIICWVGGMLESSLGGGICVELATLPNFRYPNDIFPTAHFHRTDLTETRLEFGPGLTFQPSTVPGIPYRVRPERVAALAVQQAVVTT